MNHILFFGALLVAGLLFALIEIQIEGPHGWAASLPTWKLQNRWTRLLLGVKPLTGYHLYALTFILLAVHFPFAFGLAPFSWAAEARVLSFYTFFWIVEDFLWFVLNPAFGLSRFRPQYIWWHAPAWWGVMPRDYWIFTPVATLLYCLSC
jgi:hypothetical protein